MKLGMTVEENIDDRSSQWVRQEGN